MRGLKLTTPRSEEKDERHQPGRVEADAKAHQRIVRWLERSANEAQDPEPDMPPAA